jgi:hypothetical protein
LIWQDGNNGQSIAAEAASYYQSIFIEVSKSLKRGQFLAGPGQLYAMFTMKGFGGGAYYGGRWQNMLHNTKISIYG